MINIICDKCNNQENLRINNGKCFDEYLSKHRVLYNESSLILCKKCYMFFENTVEKAIKQAYDEFFREEKEETKNNDNN